MSRGSLQKVQGGHTGRPPIPHHLHCGSRYVPLPLGDGSSQGGSGTIWVREGGRADGDRFLCGQRRPGIYKVGVAPAGI